jgi:hypothetical protein
LKPYPGKFIHGIDLGDWYPCWNLALCGRLSSPDFAALCDPGLAASHRPLRDVPIDVLRVSGVPQGVPTPRATRYVWAAAWVRNGGHVGIGVDNTQWLPKGDLEKILALGDTELAFEEVRRKVLPDGASRLASLYVADDSETGRAHVRRMLGWNVRILKVIIPLCLRVTRVDTKWFELYCREPKVEYIEKYWSSAPFDPPSPTWEYLVDGLIEVDDPEGLSYIRSHGAHLNIWKGTGQSL